MKALALAVSVLMALTTSAFAEPLTGEQIKQQLVGKALNFKQGKFSGTVSYMADGSAKTNITESKINDTGRWVVKGDQLCVTWKKLRAGKEACNAIESTGANRFKAGTDAEIWL